MPKSFPANKEQGTDAKEPQAPSEMAHLINILAKLIRMAPQTGVKIIDLTLAPLGFL
jgi:hypothetical protein